MTLHEKPSAVRADLFGGKGTVRVWSLLRHAAAPFTAVLWCELDPGGSVGRHVQEEFPEIVIGIEGNGEATVDGTPHPLGEGDAIHLPLGAVLSITNRASDAPLRYVIVKARGLAEAP